MLYVQLSVIHLLDYWWSVSVLTELYQSTPTFQYVAVNEQRDKFSSSFVLSDEKLWKSYILLREACMIHIGLITLLLYGVEDEMTAVQTRSWQRHESHRTKGHWVKQRVRKEIVTLLIKHFYYYPVIQFLRSFTS